MLHRVSNLPAAKSVMEIADKYRGFIPRI